MASETKNDGGAAFPFDMNAFPHPGMSLRDYFAGQALAGIMASRDMYLAIMADRGSVDPEIAVAKACNDQADAMLKARED